jgi:hypothetical protein
MHVASFILLFLFFYFIIVQRWELVTFQGLENSSVLYFQSLFYIVAYINIFRVTFIAITFFVYVLNRPIN